MIVHGALRATVRNNGGEGATGCGRSLVSFMRVAPAFPRRGDGGARDPPLGPGSSRPPGTSALVPARADQRTGAVAGSAPGSGGGETSPPRRLRRDSGGALLPEPGGGTLLLR